MTWASVVLPEPGGPHRISERRSSASMARRSGLPGAQHLLLAEISSSVRGRMRSASGASGRGPRAGAALPARGRAGRSRRRCGTVMPGRAVTRKRDGARPRRRCRAASKSRMPAATPTLRLSTRRPHRDRRRAGRRGAATSAGRPAPSVPEHERRRAAQVDRVVGRRAADRGRDDRARRARRAAPARPRAASRRTWGSRNALPIEPRSAFQENGSAQPSVR